MYSTDIDKEFIKHAPFIPLKHFKLNILHSQFILFIQINQLNTTQSIIIPKLHNVANKNYANMLVFEIINSNIKLAN